MLSIRHVNCHFSCHIINEVSRVFVRFPAKELLIKSSSEILVG